MSKPYRVAVIGDAMIDYRRSSSTSRPSPEDPDCRILSNLSTEIELGGAANVARWLAAQQGVEVHLYCHWADDEAGDDLNYLCGEAGVRLSKDCFRGDCGAKTTRKERVCVSAGRDGTFTQIVRCDEDTASVVTEEEFTRLRSQLADRRFDLVVVVDYDKGMFRGSVGDRLIRCLGVWPPRTVVNSKCTERWRFALLDTLICNRQEAFTDSKNLSVGAVASLRCRQMVVTLGPRGVFCNLSMEPESTERRILHAPTLADKVIDVTGAGDAFTAGFAHSILRRSQLAGHAGSREQEVKEWLHQGQRWAAHCCAQIGCGEPLRAAAVATPDIMEGSTDVTV